MVDVRDYRKVAAVPPTATAYSSRTNTAMMFPDLRWDNPKLDSTVRSETSAITAFVREKLKEARFAAKVQDDGQRDITAIYPNVSGGVAESKSVFGPNLERLKEIKKKYDPTFLFDKWYPISPE